MEDQALTLTFAGGIKLSMHYYVYILKCSDGRYSYSVEGSVLLAIAVHLVSLDL